MGRYEQSTTFFLGKPAERDWSRDTELSHVILRVPGTNSGRGHGLNQIGLGWGPISGFVQKEGLLLVP